MRGMAAMGLGTALLATGLACGGLGGSGGEQVEEGAASEPAADVATEAVAWQSRTLCTPDEEVLLSCFPFGDSPVGVLSICAGEAPRITVREGVLGKAEHEVPPARIEPAPPIDWFDVDPGPDAASTGTTTLMFSVDKATWTLTEDGEGLRLARSDGPDAACAGEVRGSLEAVRPRIRGAGGVGRPPVDGSTPP